VVSLGAYLGREDTHSAAETIMSAYESFVRRGEKDAAHEWLDSGFIGDTLPFLCARHEFFSAWVRRVGAHGFADRTDETTKSPNLAGNSPRIVDAADFAPWADQPQAVELSETVFCERVLQSAPKRWLSVFPNGYEFATVLGLHSLLTMSESRSPGTLKYNPATFSIQGAWAVDLRPDDILRAVLDGRLIIRDVTVGAQE
jgi:hypothetical protein